MGGLEENQPGCGAEIPLGSGMGKPVATLSEARPLGFFVCFGDFIRGEGARGEGDSGRRGGWEGRGSPEHNFPRRLCEQGGPC